MLYLLEQRNKNNLNIIIPLSEIEPTMISFTVILYFILHTLISVNGPLPNSSSSRNGNSVSRKNSTASNTDVAANRTHSRNSSLDLRTVGRIPSQDQLRFIFFYIEFMIPFFIKK